MISMNKSNTRFAETKDWEKVYVEQKEKFQEI